MAITDIPILGMLRSRMEWSQARQRVLAENVANADTPGFKPKDLAPLKFPDPGDGAPATAANIALATTEPGHIVGIGGSGSGFAQTNDSYQVHPSGNAVNIEEEMMKVASNQMDYEAATAVYTRSLNLLKLALDNK
jgi:flagellar basal-body rod protein FlgB